MKVRTALRKARVGLAWSQEPVQVGVGVSIIRAGESGTSTPGARTAVPILVSSPVTRVEKESSANGFRQDAIAQ
jgi:hypothetical protein